LTIEEIRKMAEADLEVFIKLVHPKRILGAVHREIISWWNREDARSHQLLLMPRDHMKSGLTAYRVAWTLTKHPELRILYVSSTANLAIKQLKFIKDIFLSDNYRRYWPEMVNADEFKREKWTETEIALDHPIRKELNVRDPSIFTAGLTTNIVGMHCDIAVLDDVVTDDTAYTQEGRDRVRTQYSLLSSIEGAESKEWVAGTRYYPTDLYDDMLKMRVTTYNQDGSIKKDELLFEVFERQVESVGDGTGEYLWPFQVTKDGRGYGFNQDILARKRSQYLNKTKFRAQYYNDPNDSSEADINSNSFQYYDPKYLYRSGGYWYFKNNRLNVVASLDLAYTTSKRADFTTIAIVGMDGDNNYFILELDRFKTDKISEYFKHILHLHQKWGFRQLIAEYTAAQSVIVKDLKENYIKRYGLALSVKEHKPTRHEGTKIERINAVLQPRYENLQVYHYPGGNCSLLEEELVLRYPAHDDLKDAVAICMENVMAPTFFSSVSNSLSDGVNQLKNITNTRFGGIG
jgi:phage terminase large subunit-like protein